MRGPGAPVPTAGVFLAEQYPPEDRAAATAEGRPHFIYWRTEEVQAKKTDRLQARAAVVAAWKRLKARELAQNKANEIAEKIRHQSVSDPSLLSRVIQDLQLGPATRRRGSGRALFTIPNVAPLTPALVQPQRRPASKCSACPNRRTSRTRPRRW